MKYIFVILLLPFFVFSEEWFDVFLSNARKGNYKQTEQVAKWKKLILKKKMTFWCTDDLKYVSFKEVQQKDYKLAEHLLGKPLGKRKCQITFPRAGEQTLQDVFQTLWGFSNVGFYPENCYGSYMEIEIQVKDPNTFVFQIQIVNSQIIIKDIKGKKREHGCTQ